jgi:hypothetical protein
MSYKTDELRYAVYARHGDMCSCGEYGTRDCASGKSPDDYVVVARFAYLTEAIDYAHVCAARGVNIHLRSQRIGSKAYDVSVYSGADMLSKPQAIAQHVTSTLAQRVQP